MKRFSAFICCFLAAVCLFGTPVAAADDFTDEQLKISGIEELFRLIPEESGQEIHDVSDALALARESPGEVFSRLWALILGKLTAPLRLFALSAAVLFCAALLNAFSDTLEGEGTAGAFRTVTALAVSGAVLAPCTQLIQDTSRVIDELSVFILGFIPVFSGITAAAGKPATAAACQGILFAAAQFFSQIAANIIVPLLGIFLAVCVAGSIGKTVSVSGIIAAVKKTANWILGLCLTVFIGLLTLQSLVTGPADSVANRTARFVISSVVPVVGSALSEAYNSIFGCLSVVKSTVGVFGIVIMLLTFLPLAAELALMLLSLHLSGALGEVLQVKEASEIFGSAASALSIMLGLILCYALMILVSVTLILLMGTG